MKRLFAATIVSCLSLPASAADLGPYPSKSQPKQPAAQTTIFDEIGPKPNPSFQPSAAVYVGVLGGYGVTKLSTDDFDPKDGNAEVGGYLGYTIRATQLLSVGLEADYMRTSLKFDPNCPEDDATKSKWTASLRGLAGFHLSDRVMLFGTAGWAWSDLGDPGPVYGGGLAFGLTEKATFKVEGLRYDFGGIQKDRDVARAGLSYQLN